MYGNHILLAAILSVTLGCADSTAKNAIPNLPYVELAKGANSASGTPTQKQIRVISSQAEYAAALANYTSATPESLDFTQGKVLLIDMGTRNTGGYSVAVARAYDAGEWVQTEIHLVFPGAGCVVTQALTNPYQFVFIPSHKEILISEIIVKAPC